MILFFIIAPLLLISPNIVYAVTKNKSLFHVMKVIKNFFAMPTTVIHELGHALMAIFTFGKAHYIQLRSDLSGIAVTSSPNRLAVFFVKIAGYTTASAVSYIMFKMLIEQAYEELFIMALVISALALYFIRNFFGVLWLISFGGLFYSLFYYEQYDIIGFLFTFLVLLNSVVAWVDTYALVRMTATAPHIVSDATDLSKLTKIPAIVWSFSFFTFASYLLFLQLQLIL